jgi:hypothetical protein
VQKLDSERCESSIANEIVALASDAFLAFRHPSISMLVLDLIGVDTASREKEYRVHLNGEELFQHCATRVRAVSMLRSQRSSISATLQSQMTA